MGLPFVIAEAVSFITGSNGKIAEVTLDNRLQVESKQSDLPSDGVQHFNNKLSYDDMLLIPRSTVINIGVNTSIYSYTGTGLFLGGLITLEKLDDDWSIQLLVDGVDILNSISTKDMDKTSKYSLDSNKDINDPWIGLDVQKDTFRFKSPFNTPIKFSTSIEIKVNPINSNLKFKAGLINLIKET